VSLVVLGFFLLAAFAISRSSWYSPSNPSKIRVVQDTRQEPNI
jgi:hypothetical protein